MSHPRAWRLILTLALAAVGIIANVTTLVRFDRPDEIGLAEYLISALPFAGFAVIARGSRHHGPTSMAALICVLLACVLAVWSCTVNPFGEWGGIAFAVMLVPAQFFLGACVLAVGVISRLRD